MKNLSKDEILLLIVGTIYTLASGMATVFMNVYLYSFTESLIGMTTFTIFRIAMFPIMFTLNGKLFKKAKLGYPLAAGLIMMTCSYILLLSMQNSFAENPMLIYLIAVIFGAGEGSYWFTLNSLNQLATTKKSRGIFVSIQGIVNGLANIIAPVTASILISHSITDTEGYLTIFKVVIILYIVIALISLKIQTKATPMPFTLMDKLLCKVDKQWTYVSFCTLFNGLRDSVPLTLAGLLIYRATSGSGSLYSQLLSMFAVLSIFSYMICGKIITRKNRMIYYSLGGIFLCSSTMILALVPNIYGALYYGMVNAFAYPFFGTPYTIICMNALQDYQQDTNLVGFVVAREYLTSIGRIVGMCTVFLFARFFDQDTAVACTTVLVSLCPIIQIVVANIYHKKRDKAKIQAQ